MEKVIPEIIYDKTQWKIKQRGYNSKYVAKSESIMAQGNGHIGLRAADEESIATHYHRNMFIAGSYNKPSKVEVPELPNLADLTHLDIEMDGEILSPNYFDEKRYKKSLNLKNGELKRSFMSNCADARVLVVNRRFVSMKESSLIVFRTIIKVVKGKIGRLSVSFGIDGQQTNSGVQHFDEGIGRVYKDETNFVLEYIQDTTQAALSFAHHIGFRAYLNDKEIFSKSGGSGKRRQVKGYVWVHDLNVGDVLIIERIANVTSNVDYNNRLLLSDNLVAQGYREVRKYLKKSYKQLLLESASEWRNIWKHYDIKVDSPGYENLAFRFAVYHLIIMTPIRTTYATPGAKGLTGEVYKGHAFWDNEIFIAPVYSYMNPQIARNMMFYRYRNLLGARKKAKEYGYLGAMYPWEAAFPYDAEACPKYGNIDGETGETSIVWPGIIEQHPVADVAYGVSWYCEVTRDMDFLYNYGIEIIFEVARFWTSRAEYNSERDVYEIKNVIGPNEYKEHINNNAFTNYMAKWSIDWVFEHSKKLLNHDHESEINRMFEKLGISQREIDRMRDVAKKLYIPRKNREGIIEENDTYLTLPDIENISDYRDPNRWITREIPWEIVKRSQVTKQADVVCLLWLQRWLFDSKTIIDNIKYYDLRTVHESSLSYNTHALLALQERMNEAMFFFDKALQIDMGDNLTSSDEGIHAASLGGIWQMFYFGIAGVSAYKELYISPRLPENWNSISLKFYYKGNLIRLKINHEDVQISLARGFRKLPRHIPIDRLSNVMQYKKTPTPIMVTFNNAKAIKVVKNHTFKMDKKINVVKEYKA